MYTYINFFPHFTIQRQQQLSNFASGVQKWLGTNKFVRTKSHIRSKFSKISLGRTCTGGTVVVHLYCGFSLASDGATPERQILNCIFGKFCTSLRKDSVANYASIWMLFSPPVMGPDVLCNALNIRHFRRQVAPQQWKVCGAKCFVQLILRQ